MGEHPSIPHDEYAEAVATLGPEGRNELESYTETRGRGISHAEWLAAMGEGIGPFSYLTARSYCGATQGEAPAEFAQSAILNQMCWLHKQLRNGGRYPHAEASLAQDAWQRDWSASNRPELTSSLVTEDPVTRRVFL